MMKRHKILETVGLSHRHETFHTLGLTKDPETSFLENFGGTISCLGGVALLLTGSGNWVLCLCFVVIGVTLTQFGMIIKNTRGSNKNRFIRRTHVLGHTRNLWYRRDFRSPSPTVPAFKAET